MEGPLLTGVPSVRFQLLALVVFRALRSGMADVIIMLTEEFFLLFLDFMKSSSGTDSVTPVSDNTDKAMCMP